MKPVKGLNMEHILQSQSIAFIRLWFLVNLANNVMYQGHFPF